MNYGNMMKYVRIRTNISQKEISQVLNISNYTYSHYETQDSLIPLKHLITFANYFNVSLDYLFNFTSKVNYPDLSKNLNLITMGNNLKTFRKNNKITQNKLAKQLCIARSILSEYEHGNYLISTSTLYTLCKIYNISADYLLYSTKELIPV